MCIVWQRQKAIYDYEKCLHSENFNEDIILQHVISLEAGCPAWERASCITCLFRCWRNMVSGWAGMSFLICWMSISY